jgi:hypothetical protein
MANQYTIKDFTNDEIRCIITSYQSGSSLSSLAKTYKCGKHRVKSDYTYDVMVGLKENRWTVKIDTTQYNKIKWVNKNVLPVEIVVVDKRNNNLIKRKLS